MLNNQQVTSVWITPSVAEGAAHFEKVDGDRVGDYEGSISLD